MMDGVRSYVYCVPQHTHCEALMTRMYVTEFVVEGDVSSAFPLDMLRYDGCYPSRPEDVDHIERSLSREQRKFDRTEVGMTRRRVALTVVHENKANGGSVGRWESFGWAVVESHTRPR